MNSDVSSPIKYAGTIVEYLDQGRLKAGLVVREQERHLAVIDSAGREKMVPRDLVLMPHPERRANRETVATVLAELERERVALAAELDLQLLWEVAQEQSRSFSAAELADLFFGRRSNAAASVMLEALLNDRIYFVRRHMDFVPRTPEQVDRLRIQNDRIRTRSDLRRQAGVRAAARAWGRRHHRLAPGGTGSVAGERGRAFVLRDSRPRRLLPQAAGQRFLHHATAANDAVGLAARLPQRS